jgi:hypothetical protein
MVDLPNADTRFAHFFAPWYSDADRQRRGFGGVFPDMLEFPDDRGAPPERLSPLSGEGRDVVTKQIRDMLESARADFPRYLPVIGEPSGLWLDAFDDYWNTDRIGELIGQSDPADYANHYVDTCLELGAVVGQVMLATEPGLVWIPTWPYWDSGIWDAGSGWVLNPFHWAFKRMSGDGFDERLAEKIPAILDMMRRARPHGGLGGPTTL